MLPGSEWKQGQIHGWMKETNNADNGRRDTYMKDEPQEEEEEEEEEDADNGGYLKSLNIIQFFLSSNAGEISEE
jgi:hypothetical protein